MIVARVLSSAPLIIVLLTICGCRAEQTITPVAALDLRKYGYQFGDGGSAADYSEMAFLSEDLLAVSINQRSFKESPASMDTDRPASEVVVIDVRGNNVVATADIPVLKFVGAVHAVSGGRLAVLTSEGLRLCSQDLQCGPTIPGRGPLFVSPRGFRAVLGGNGMSRRTLLDLVSLKELIAFDDPTAFVEYGSGVIPGDSALLISHGATSFAVQAPGKPDKLIQFDRGGDFSESRFLDNEKIAYLDHGSGSAVVSNLDGAEQHRYALQKVYRASFLSTASGDRFGIYEHGYTVWNAFVNLLDIEDTRPENFQLVRVIDTSSGKELSRIEWNPLSDRIKHPVTPRLSPSGHLLARVRNGLLEVLQVK